MDGNIQADYNYLTFLNSTVQGFIHDCLLGRKIINHVKHTAPRGVEVCSCRKCIKFRPSEIASGSFWLLVASGSFWWLLVLHKAYNSDVGINTV